MSLKRSILLELYSQYNVFCGSLGAQGSTQLGFVLFECRIRKARKGIPERGPFSRPCQLKFLVLSGLGGHPVTVARYTYVCERGLENCLFQTLVCSVLSPAIDRIQQ